MRMSFNDPEAMDRDLECESSDALLDKQLSVPRSITHWQLYGVRYAWSFGALAYALSCILSFVGGLSWNGNLDKLCFAHTSILCECARRIEYSAICVAD